MGKRVAFWINDLLKEMSLRAVVKTSGGGIAVTGIQGQIEAGTSGGSITAKLTEQPLGDCSFKTSGGSVTIVFVRPDGREVARTLDLPTYRRLATETIALAAGNLVRDEASMLLAELTPPPAEVNPKVNAVTLDLAERARKAAQAGLPVGPLAGVPYLLKDLGAMLEGVVTSSGSAMLKDAVATADSSSTEGKYAAFR